MNTKAKPKTETLISKYKQWVPYSNQAVGCVGFSVLSLIFLFFNLFFSVAFSLLSFIFFSLTKPRVKADYDNRWFASFGFILASVTLFVVILTHIVVNNIFGILL